MTEKQKARAMVTRAIVAGKLARGNCRICGAAGAQAHHHNYAMPLDVEWLCRAHHGEKHGWRMSDREQVVKSIQSGIEPYSAIARRHGISRERVRQIAKSLGQGPRPKVYARQGGRFSFAEAAQ